MMDSRSTEFGGSQFCMSDCSAYTMVSSCAGTGANRPFARAAGRRLEVIRGDIRNRAVVARAARGVRVIFHQAAMRSVPRSVKDPLGANENNVTGTLNVLEAARHGRVARVVYASSSSVYG